MKRLWKKYKGMLYPVAGLAVLLYVFLSVNSLVFFSGQGASMCSDYESGVCAIYPGDLVMVALVESPYYDLQSGDILCYDGVVGEEEPKVICHRFYGFDESGDVIMRGDYDVSILDTTFIEFQEEVGEVMFRFPTVGALAYGVQAGYVTGSEVFNLMLGGNYVEGVNIEYT